MKYLKHSLLLYLGFMIITVAQAYSIKKSLTKTLDEKISGQYQIRYLSSEAKLEFPEMTPEMKISFEFPESSDLRGREVIFAKLVKNNEIIHAEKISVFLKIYKEIVSAKHNIEKEKIISANDLQYTNQDVTIQTNYFTKLDSIVGQCALRRIKSGRIIKSTFIRPKYDVCVGSEISIVSEKGNVTAITPGVARQNGYIGNTITVYNPSFRKTLKVKISSDKKGIISKNR